jgi:GT2 family glycosyltransferase
LLTLDRAVVAGEITVVTSEHPSTAELYEREYAFRQQRYASNGYAATANLFCRRSTLEELGGFDQDLMSSGDHDFGVRASEAGYSVSYCADAAVVHPARADTASIMRKTRRIAAGHVAVARKHRGTRGVLAVVARAICPPVHVLAHLMVVRSMPLRDRVTIGWFALRVYAWRLVNVVAFSLPGAPAAPRA